MFLVMHGIEPALAVIGLASLARAFSRTRLGRWLSTKQAYTTPYGEALLASVEGVDLSQAWGERAAAKAAEVDLAEASG